MAKNEIEDRPQAPERGQASSASSRWRWLRNVLATLCWLYMAIVIIAAIALPMLGDRWWVCTLLLFGARWPWAAPLALLVPLAAVFRRRLLIPLGIAALLAVGGIMDVRLPWRVWLDRPAAGNSIGSLRIVTWNVHRCLGMDLSAAAAWLGDQRADVIAFEEWPNTISAETFVGEGWNVLHDGELCVLSRQPIRRDLPPAFGAAFMTHAAGARYWISTPAGELPFAAVHLASPHPDFSSALRVEPGGRWRVKQNMARRTEQAADLRQWANNTGSRAIVVGDMNTASDSPIFRGLCDQLSDAFLTAGSGFGWTYEHRAALARIDHILYGPGWSCRSSRVGPMMGSPHRPVVAELWLRQK